MGLAESITYGHAPSAGFIVSLGLVWLVAILLTGLIGWKLSLRQKGLVNTGLVISIPFLALYLSAAYPSSTDLMVKLSPLLIVTTVIGGLLWSWWRGLVPKNHFLGAIVVWALVALFFYPFGKWELSGIDIMGFYLSLAAGALVVLPYPALLIDLHRSRHDEDSVVCPGTADPVSTWNLSRTQRMVLLSTVGTFALAALWFAWPAKPIYIEALRSQGKPATAADLAEAYRPGPPEINAAPHYLAIMKELSELEETWEQVVAEGNPNEDPDRARALHSKANPLVIGQVDVSATEAIWRPNWEVAQERYSMVEAPIVAALAELNQTDYEQCRFPVDYGSGSEMGMYHLSPVRKLARVQAYAIWYAAMEGRSQDIVALVGAIAPLDGTLRDAPMLMDQLVRVAIFSLHADAMEQAINRTIFSNDQLAAIQTNYSSLLPSDPSYGLVESAFFAEQVYMWSYTSSFVDADWYLFNKAYQYCLDFSRPVAFRAMAAVKPAPVAPYWPRTTLETTIENSQNTLLIIPNYSRAYETVWRCQVVNTMVATACAIERYRLAEGSLPDALDDLVPTYLESLPIDPFRGNGLPLSYIVHEDQSYVLYSWAQNRKDDGGIALPSVRDWTEGDLTFRVAPLDFRMGPQVTDVAPVAHPVEAPEKANARRGRGEEN